MLAKMMLCTTLTWARPPRKRPTIAFAQHIGPLAHQLCLTVFGPLSNPCLSNIIAR
jgi:hypothetical protein